MTDIQQYHGRSVLEQMVPHIIPGTEFDSSSRDDPPRCHPDTRTNFLEQLQARIHDSALETRIVWLVGPAGVGKSAIMQSLAEVVCPLPSLRCATLFFSRPNHRDDPKKVFTTLAYGFAVADHKYRRYIGEKLADDPSFLDKSLDEQFKRLFVAPFTTGGVNFGSRRWVVFLDGFDEINGESDQSRILDLIRESLLPPSRTIPLIWIIASRPEAHLKASFHQVKRGLKCFWKLEVPIDSEEALRSVELYLRTRFTKIRGNYSDVVPPLWPSENDFLELTKASSGLFVFASTLVDYVGKENPVLRLKHILSLIARVAVDHQDPSRQAKANPFHALDILYMMIMSDVPADSLPIATTILGFYLLGKDVSGDPPNLLRLCNILGLEQHEAYSALRKLHSVLTFPSPDKAYEEPVRFLHASFSDFLKDRSRSQSYSIDLDEELLKVWRCYGNIFKSAPEAGHITLSWKPPPAVEKELHKRIQRDARKFWFTILIYFCHERCSCESKPRHRLLPDTAEINEIFEESGVELYEVLEGGVDLKTDIIAFRVWLSDHAPIALRQRLIFKDGGLEVLSERDIDNMFRGLCTKRSAFYYLLDRRYSTSRWVAEKFSLEGLSDDRWKREKRYALKERENTYWKDRRPLNWGILANLLLPRYAGGYTAKVMIMRTKPTDFCAVIGPLDVPVSSDVSLGYLVFPYVEE